MSTTVDVNAMMRQSLRQSSFRRSPSSSPSTPVLSLSRNPPVPALPPDFLPALRQLHSRTHIAARLSLYISDLFSAARHHPQLDGTFVTARARKDVDDLVKAGRVIGRDLTGAEVIRGLAGSGREVVDGKSGDLVGLHGSGNYGGLDGCDNTSLPTGPTTSDDAHAWDTTLDISEADVARIVPRVLSHRLSVRHGPGHELLASMTFGAVNSDVVEDAWESDPNTVKNILVQILSEV
jgi:hypothetical protein